MKVHSVFAVLFIVVALVFGPALSSMAKETTGKMIDDSTITAEIKAKLAKDVRLGSLTGIEINTTKGVVTLAGKVKNEQEKIKVEEIARDVDGVKDVRDNLQIVS
jgi:hyperosmotically inducible periplasmic protein